MGYYMEQHDTVFNIKAENVNAAYQTLKAAVLAEPTDLSWVSKYNVEHARDFKSLMRECRWDVELDEDGNVTDIQFTGEKLGNDQNIFDWLAPFVSKDSFIVMSGEDSAHWKWEFDGIRCQERYGRVVFD